MAWLVVGLALAGCASSGFLAARNKPRDPFLEMLQMTSSKGLKASERTMQVLRRYDMVKDLNGDGQALLKKVTTLAASEPSADAHFAIGELAFIHGRRAVERKRDLEALDFYGVAVAQAYMYLFDPRFDVARNPYDPQFRQACDLYNGSLEGALRVVRRQGKLRPGHTFTARSNGQQFDVEIVMRGRWQAAEIERLEFTSEYDVRNLAATYRTYGLGVPLIAVRHKGPPQDPAEQFLPPGVSYPTTAFLKVCRKEGPASELPGYTNDKSPRKCVLELYDTVAMTDVLVDDRRVPLETDLTTPLAYYLNSPALKNSDYATWGLLNPEKSQAFKGLYMLEPYDPRKIPVLMVHGLWSSPLTWVEMFNDLRSDPVLRHNYQFWFYLYPSGQPFWLTAAQLRDDLAHTRGALDPAHGHAAFDQMVLVGHSMGGLVSRMQVIDSGNEFWSLASDRPFAELKASPETKEKLGRAFFFQANPSIRRVVTIATPHQGSNFANSTTRYIGNKFISVPAMMKQATLELAQGNPKSFFKSSDVLKISTSIDSLAPDCPAFGALNAATPSPLVREHNIVAVIPNEGLVGRLAAGSDGVVSLESARRENVVSEKVIAGDHLYVHRLPGAVREVRRILWEHLHQSAAEWQATAGDRVTR